MAETIGDTVDAPFGRWTSPSAPRAPAWPARSCCEWMHELEAAEEARDDARLVVSELVGNAVRHARPLADGTMRVAWAHGPKGSTSPSATAAP